MNKIKARFGAAVFASALIAGVLQPTVQADVLSSSLASMPPNSWQRLNLNQFQEVWTPKDLWPTLASPESNISGWSGAAWDSLRKDLLIWGGDIGDEQGNEVYVFHTSTGLWERGAVPSQITRTGLITHVVDGVNSAPISGESWDNVIYLPGVDRMAVIGVSREGLTFQNLDGSPTGPYFWDPARAAPWKVSGTTGSHVNLIAYPNIVGGEMWQNRNNFAPDRSAAATGVTAHVRVGGKDVVYFAGRYDELWRYTVTDLNPANDTWELIGTRPALGNDGRGAADIDPRKGLLVQTLGEQSFGFWDVDNTHEGSTKNREVQVFPAVTAGTPPASFVTFGLQFDPVLDAFLLWGGNQDVWVLRPPDDLDPDGDGILSEATGWTLSPLHPTGAGPTIPTKFTGVYGKWLYLAQENAYLGVIDPIAGDVFVYKPPVKLPGGGGALTLNLGVSQIVGCTSVVGTVKLPAPALSDRVVTITDTLPAASAPATVTIAAGATFSSFAVKTTAVNALQSGLVTATLDGESASQPLSLRPIGPKTMTFKPTSTVGGTLPGATAKMTLECRAGPGPITVDLSTAKPEVAYPVAANVVVPVGTQTAVFDVMTNQVYGKALAPISASVNGTTTTRSLTVLPWANLDPPTSLKFGGVVVGTASDALNATLTNKGVGSFVVSYISVTGTGASWFAQTNDCPATLAPGASCTIGVTFRPLSATNRTATLGVATSATTAPLTVRLSGTGLPP
jgi:hypothetical protein